MIVGTGTTDISYPSDPSCSPSSVSGSDTCILVFDNIGNVDNENVQIGTFANGPPDFSVTAIPDSLTVFQGSSSTSQVVVSSTGGYSGPVSLTSTVSPVVTNGPTSSLSTNSVTLTPGSSSTVILTVSASLSTPTGSYNVTVTGTGTLTFNTPVSSKYVGSRITYTATLFFGASQTQSPTSASGSFKVSQ